jgi:hypothetical protein
LEVGWCVLEAEGVAGKGSGEAWFKWFALEVGLCVVEAEGVVEGLGRGAWE